MLMSVLVLSDCASESAKAVKELTDTEYKLYMETMLEIESMMLKTM